MGPVAHSLSGRCPSSTSPHRKISPRTRSPVPRAASRFPPFPPITVGSLDVPQAERKARARELPTRSPATPPRRTKNAPQPPARTRELPDCLLQGGHLDGEMMQAWPSLVEGSRIRAIVAKRLYQQYNVTVLPGSYLSRECDGINPGAGYIRIALVADLAQCVDAAKRIRDCIEQ